MCVRGVPPLVGCVLEMCLYLMGVLEVYLYVLGGGARGVPLLVGCVLEVCLDLF